MRNVLHITKRPSAGWAVARSAAGKAWSIHRTQAEAIAAARELAVESGGAEVVVHAADGRIRGRDTVTRSVKVAPRAPRSEGPRTTLRVPDALVRIADDLAEELAISRNDALLRLATRGAHVYEQEQQIAARAAERWAAVVPGDVAIDLSGLPSPEEARAAALELRTSANDA